MRLALAALAAALLLPLPAQARTWTDPGLRRAVEAAELIVRVQAPAIGSKEHARVRFRVLDTLKGPALRYVTVGNLHDPDRCKAPVFAPDEQLYLLLVRGPKGRLQVPTPTLGRFPIRGDLVRYAALRGTHLRLDLPRSDFEAYLRLMQGKVDADWAVGLRRHLDRSTLPTTRGLDLARLYLGLETLAQVGKPEDAARAKRFLKPEAPYQLRVSALRALTRCEGVGAVPALLRAAQHDIEPAVRTAAVRCLGRVVKPADVARLLALLPHTTQEPVYFTGPTDPRENTWPSPRVALLGVINKLGKAAVRTAAPALLKQLDDPRTSIEALGATLKILVRVGKRVAPDLVTRLGRHPDLRGRLTDAAICATLQEMTGLPYGVDTKAWRLWGQARARRLR